MEIQDSTGTNVVVSYLGGKSGKAERMALVGVAKR